MNPPRTPPAAGPSVFTETTSRAETPSRTRHYGSNRYLAGTLDEARTIVVEDLGEVPMISVNAFIERVLPPVGKVDLAQIKASLVKGKHINKKNRWNGFNKDPKQSGKNENNAFQALPSVFNNIVEAASSTLQDSQARLHFVYRPNNAPASERNNDTRPDGQLELITKKSLGKHVSQGIRSNDVKSRWEDIVVPFEFKLDEKDYLDNVKKLIWSAHHIMRTDPCRRFTFGITAENTRMRLWFFTRSHVMVTHPFNFIQELDILIRFFTSLAFAGFDNLGFDSTVSRIEVNGQIRYKFQVGNEFYITTGTLADSAANFILGRGTRVFQAHKESNPHHVVALKDVWLEDDRMLEGALLESMRANIAERQAQGTVFPGSKDASAYFLTVEAHGRVKVNDNINDHTVDVMMRGMGFPADLEYFSTSSWKAPSFRDSRVKGSDRGYSVGHTPQISSDMAEAMRAHMPRTTLPSQGRVHYRIVFSEVGQTVHELRQLSHVYQCLLDATIALEIMHILGYVHRDISAGNVLFYNDAGMLCDLESAKKTTDITTHEVRTGTNQFEPIEVNGQAYHFRDIEDDTDGPVFKFNCIHDLESTWWIALWVLFHHTPVDDEGDRNAQLMHAGNLFPPVGKSADRVRVFSQVATIRKIIPSLNPAFQPAANQLIAARKLLVQRYKIAEAGPSIDERAFDGLHQELGAIWQGCRDGFQDIEYRWVLSSKHGATDDPESSSQPSSKKPRIH